MGKGENDLPASGLSGDVEIPGQEDSMGGDTKEIVDGVVSGMSDVQRVDPSRARSREPADVDMWIPTGCTPLDYATWLGWPVGCQVLLKGPKSTGKTSLAIQAGANVQKMGGVFVYLDREDSFSPHWAELVGVDIDQMIYHEPRHCEEALTKIRDIASAIYQRAEEDVPVLIVWDSVSNTPVKAEVESGDGLRDIGDPENDVPRGAHAELLSQAYRQLPSFRRLNMTLMPIVQPKTDPGAGPYASAEEKEKFLAQRPLNHYSHVIVDMSKDDWIGNEDNPEGIRLKAKIQKNKVGPPERSAKVPLRFGSGIDNVMSIFEHLEKFGGIQRAGSRYYLNIDHEAVPGKDEKTFYRKDFKEFIERWTEEFPELKDILRQKIKANFRPEGSGVDESEVDEKLDDVLPGGGDDEESGSGSDLRDELEDSVEEGSDGGD